MNIDQDLALPRQRVKLLLSDHHRRLETKCREMLAWVETDDSQEHAASWCELEAELLDHIAAEEELILPSYAVDAPADAKRIRGDHARIRELVVVIGVEVERHEARVKRLHILVDTLDAHADHEDRLLYPWAERNLGEIASQLLFARISRWFATG